MSPESRERIAAAQKKRWADSRAEATEPEAEAPATKKRGRKAARKAAAA